jgi:hypothetical protein
MEEFSSGQQILYKRSVCAAKIQLRDCCNQTIQAKETYYDYLHLATYVLKCAKYKYLWSK